MRMVKMMMDHEIDPLPYKMLYEDSLLIKKYMKELSLLNILSSDRIFGKVRRRRNFRRIKLGSKFFLGTCRLFP